VLILAGKFLESHVLNCSYKLSTLNQKSGEDNYDLVISNYAFYEIPKEIQLMYIRKIMRKCKRGYLIMNSGLQKNKVSQNKLTITELRRLLPKFEVEKEDPLTHPDNYVIVWGRTTVS
jgi:hypothetical protein